MDCVCCSVHIRTEEKVNLTMSRDGGVESMEVHGIVTLRVTKPDLCTVKVQMDNSDKNGAQIQVLFDLTF